MPQIKITIPDEIYKQLKNQAKRNYRTMGQEVSYIIKNYKKEGNQNEEKS